VFIPGTPQKILTVSELTLLIRERIEAGLPDVWIEGEISNLRTPGSGHFYFTLKDEWCQIRVVLFRLGAQRLRFALREGMQVIVRGRLSVYEARGEYQLVLEYLEPKGIGARHLAFEQLKEQLAREGLFDPGRKRPLPMLPRCVGVVTSLTGAALQDMLTVLHRRCSILKVLIYPVSVQGDGAAIQIAHAICALGESGDVDVIIVGRGGGSWEDLWCFNEERVVRAIVASPVPVVSAIGHEIDFTLADFAADHRAPTPSAAAEAVAPVLRDLARTIRHLCDRQERGIRARFDQVHQRIADYSGAMALLFRVRRYMQRLDESGDRLRSSLKSGLDTLRQRIQRHSHDLIVQSPRTKVQGNRVLVPQLIKRLEERIRSRMTFRSQRVRALVATLDALSPLGVLARGYSIVSTSPEGRVITRASDVAMNDEIGIRLGQGRLVCGVRRVLTDSS